MIYGYARVSTAGQSRDGNSLEDQTTALQQYGCQEIITEAYSGKTMERPEFQKLLKRLQSGDTLVVTKLDRFARTAIDGVQTNDSSVLTEKIAQKRPGDKVTISYKRNDSNKKVEVKLKNRVGKSEPITKDTTNLSESLGGKFQDVSRQICEKLEIRGGVQVVSVKRDGLLARSGVKEGFVITYINDRPILSTADFQRINEKVTTIDGVYPNGRALRYVIVAE